MFDCNNPELRTWVPVPQDSDFPLQNLPFGIFQPPGLLPRAGIAIGNDIIDLSELTNRGFFKKLPIKYVSSFDQVNLNDFINLGRNAWRAVREEVSKLLHVDNAWLRDNTEARQVIMHAQKSVQMLLPVAVGDYVDFYSSIDHATNVGKMVRDPSNPLLPNWKHIPIGYHGRSSSIVVSNTSFHRPYGQSKLPTEESPTFGPSKKMDFELEMGAIIGKGNSLGSRVAVEDADDHIFGFVLLNDWSARDLQTWEYVPLGPFLGKSFATSISPWIVTLDALEPFRVANQEKIAPVLPYLQTKKPGNFDINLDVFLENSNLKEAFLLSKSNFKHMYWNVSQQIAHLTSNGTNMRVGDLYASGTISGPTPDSLGCLLELSWNGTKPISLPDGSTRTFLQDNDTVVLKGYATQNGVRIGFGEVRGQVLAAL